ncbi:hypothetical protein AVEN_179159-1 [Araneus ventricosus]|uniref:Uncharacterized protein n=1 Tax=Araneus ventricosus TaxID=182803 RepID=A0A4Y2HME9_ARAVE|nr:hypothetical protein AVEN_179159-1 [Araneus ventricosus]
MQQSLYMANLQWNRVSNLEPFGLEAETLPLDHCAPPIVYSYRNHPGLAGRRPMHLSDGHYNSWGWSPSSHHRPRLDPSCRRPALSLQR